MFGPVRRHARRRVAWLLARSQYRRECERASRGFVRRMLDHEWNGYRMKPSRTFARRRRIEYSAPSAVTKMSASEATAIDRCVGVM